MCLDVRVFEATSQIQKGLWYYEYSLFVVYHLSIFFPNLLLHMKATLKRTKVSSYSQLIAMLIQMQLISWTPRY